MKTLYDYNQNALLLALNFKALATWGILVLQKPIIHSAFEILFGIRERKTFSMMDEVALKIIADVISEDLSLRKIFFFLKSLIWW